MKKQKVLTQQRLNTSDSMVKSNHELIMCSHCSEVLIPNQALKACRCG